ncbi:hypothetical protein [uncultured Alsobacter sp.]|uniref:hypothetical protein n=1 Tax=uncultured Alsobacter sp. TaxID=1748258 RepID=UPI0025DD52A2|nr:hypothetical protein [uncultured Alsobacter sp.]
MTRDEFLARIDEAYGYRVEGNVEAIRSMFAPDGIFRIGGGRLPLQGVLHAEPSAVAAISALIDNYVFKSVQRLGAIVEGNKAAVLSRAEIAPLNGPVHSVELFDLVTIGPDGRFTSFIQFIDAGFIATLARQ